MSPNRRGLLALLVAFTLPLAGCTQPSDAGEEEGEGGTGGGTGGNGGSGGTGGGTGGGQGGTGTDPGSTSPPTGGTSPAPPLGQPPRNVTAVAWLEHTHLGPVLTDKDLRTLYVFAPDSVGASTCTGACAANWPPVLVEGMPIGPGEEVTSRLDSVARDDDTMQLTIDGRPLYRFIGDTESGQAHGQARNGAWFVVRQDESPGERAIDPLGAPGSHDVTSMEVAYAPEANGYFARPETRAAFPGVVLVHAAWGLNDHTRTMAQALASHGYAVLAADLFDGAVADNADTAQAQAASVDSTEATSDLQAAVAYLRSDAGAPAVAVLGWGFGGGQAMQLSVSGTRLDASVVYYGDLVTDEDTLKVVNWPVMGVFGDADAEVPPSQVQAFQQAMVNLSIPHEVQVYPNQGHAFADPQSDTYDPEAAMDAWAKTLAFLDARLRAPDA